MSETDFSRFDEMGRLKQAPAIPQFYVEAVHMEFASKQAGRPIYEDREFVKILIPGDRRTAVVEPVNDEHRARWADQYKAFTEGREAPLEGTPLRDWPSSGMTTSRVEELAYFNIKTVEQLAGVSDGHLQNLGMGARELRERAKVWLEAARKGAAPIERLISKVEDLTRENERLTRDLTAANTEIAVLKEQSNARSAA